MRHSTREVVISSQLGARQPRRQAHGSDRRGEVATDLGTGTAGDEGTGSSAYNSQPGKASKTPNIVSILTSNPSDVTEPIVAWPSWDPLVWIMSFNITDDPDCLTLSIAVLL